MSSVTPLLALVLSLSLVSSAFSHGTMAIPNQRGTLDKGQFNPQSPVIDPDSESDYKPHFPAGDKCDTPGCGKHSQERAAGSGGWRPFTPLDQGYRWHAGVCGDAFGNPEHMRGGKYYNSGQVVAAYRQGGKIAFEMNVIAHHNGYFEFHVCNIAKCDGEISQKCFREGHCKQLQRSYHQGCDGGYSKDCAPRDPNFPGRWYLPCSRFGLADGLETFGKGGTILYDLPEKLACKHCVVQWYWATANGCNPPGVIDYYDSPNAPKNWGQCVGQGGAKGGVAREQRACGKSDDGEMRTPEEYLQCADISIESTQGRADTRPSDEDTSEPEPATPTKMPTTTPTPSKSSKPEPMTKPEPVTAEGVMPTETPEYPMEASPEVSSEPSAESGVGDRSGETMKRSGVIADVKLYADGEAVRSLYDGDEVDVSGYEGFTIQAITSKEVHKVQFYINGKHVRDEYKEPYFLSGNHGTKVFYWKNPIVNEEFTLVTKADGDMDTVTIKLIDEA